MQKATSCECVGIIPSDNRSSFIPPDLTALDRILRRSDDGFERVLSQCIELARNPYKLRIKACPDDGELQSLEKRLTPVGRHKSGSLSSTCDPSFHSSTSMSPGSDQSPHRRFTFGGEEPCEIPNDSTPRYLEDIPVEVVNEFGMNGAGLLKLKDAGFRRLVKKVCKLPAYFAVILFDRIKEYREITATLVQELRVSASALHYVPSFPATWKMNEKVEDDTICLRDFLRFCTSSFRAGSRSTKFTNLITPPTKEAILSLETEKFSNLCRYSKRLTIARTGVSTRQRVSMKDFEPLLQSLVDRHPDLRFIRGNNIQRSRYIVCVLTSLFASLGAICSETISVSQLQNSRIPDLFFRCAVRSLNEVLPFSPHYFHEIHDAFEQGVMMTQKENCEFSSDSKEAVINMESLKATVSFDVSDAAVWRIFSSNARPLCSGVPGKMNFKDFMYFMLAQKDEMSSFSMEYWFRVLDLDQDGYISLSDIENFYREKLSRDATVDNDDIPRRVDELVCYVTDMIRSVQRVSSPAAASSISLMEVRKSTIGPILFERFIRRSLPQKVIY